MADNGAVDDDLEPADDTPGAMTQDSPGTVNSRASGASIVQVETLGKNGVFALYISAFISAVALVSVIVLSLWMGRLSSRIYVLEYDMSRVCGQLTAQEIIEVCH